MSVHYNDQNIYASGNEIFTKAATTAEIQSKVKKHVTLRLKTKKAKKKKAKLTLKGIFCHIVK